MFKRNREKAVQGNESFPTDTAGLPMARPTEVIRLADGGHANLRIAPVVKRVGEQDVRMLAYDGSIPGPTLRVPEGSQVVVDVTNESGIVTTVHWHGLRLENAYDGTHETQAPIPDGGSFAYRIRFPDPGVYWYHPHVREDYGQEMGLYANILVDPKDPGYWPPAHREMLLTLDDVLIEGGKIASFGRAETNYAAMGRYGNTMLVAGETALKLHAQPGEVVRLYLTNTANARVFNVAIPGARMKLVGGDSGRYEHEEFVESVILAPSERTVIDVLFASAGSLALEHRTPKRTYVLATIEVAGEPATPSLAGPFAVLRHNAEWISERERLRPCMDAPPDKTLAIVAEMNMEAPPGPVVYTCPMHPAVVRDKPGRCPKCWMKLLATSAPTHYACPMHPDVVSDKPDKCPKCGMKLVPSAAPASYVCPMHPDVVGTKADKCPKCGMKLVPAAVVAQDAKGGARAHGGQEHHGHGDHAPRMEHAGHGQDAAHAGHDATDGIEWEDDMVDVNRLTTTKNTHWSFVDRGTGARNHAIQWNFRVGDRVKVRLVNEMDSDHPMHHPFHVHGAGRFVVLSRDGVAEKNLVWKDTVLVRTGQTVDILLDVTNPGIWMAHCHISEHHESGMMFSFQVAPAAGPGPGAPGA